MNTRLSIDVPLESHTFLKKKAAEKHISIREYVMNMIDFMKEKDSTPEPEIQYASKAQFRRSASRINQKYGQLFKELASI